MKKRQTLRLPPEERLIGLNQIILRIGSDARERLEWVINLVQRNPSDMTEGDRENARMELAAFIHLGNPLPESIRSRLNNIYKHLKLPRQRQRLMPIADDLIVPIIDRLRQNLQHVVRREHHYPTDKEVRFWRVWDEYAQRWSGHVLQDFAAPDRAAMALDRLVDECGESARECPAPAVRAKADEMCGRWFVAKRPNQDYCSSTCQSRTSTKAARLGTGTAADKRRKEVASLFGIKKR